MWTANFSQSLQNLWKYNILNLSVFATRHAFHLWSNISAKAVEVVRRSDNTVLFFMVLCGCSNFCIIKIKM